MDEDFACLFRTSLDDSFEEGSRKGEPQGSEHAYVGQPLKGCSHAEHCFSGIFRWLVFVASALVLAQLSCESRHMFGFFLLHLADSLKASRHSAHASEVREAALARRVDA